LTILVALALGLCAAETLLAIAASRGLALSVILVAHLIVLAAAGLWLLRASQRRDRYAWLLWLSTAAFGPLGPAGVVLAIAVERRQARHATSLDEWHATLFPPSDDHEDAELWRRIGQRQSDQADPDVTSFFDVLTFGSVRQRQAVIAVISQQFRPEFAPVLRAALRDEHNVVRVQAATAIGRLEQQIFERTLELEAAVERAPGDAEAVLALAAHHDSQAFSGILDPSREAASRVRAAEGYATGLRLRPDDQTTEFRLARLFLRRGLAAEAEPGFRRLVGAGYPGATLWLMECLFALGRYDQVREVAAAADAGEVARLTPDVRTMLDLWTGIGDAA